MAEELKAHLDLNGDVLTCRVQGKLTWELPARDIILIAEHTTNQGPLLDDYFLHFWSHDGDKYFEATVTFYNSGGDRVLAELGKLLGAELRFGLTSSTVWDSRVVWPPELSGHKYYTFVEVKPITLWQHLRRRLFGPRLEMFLTHAVQAHLKSCEAAARS